MTCFPDIQVEPINNDTQFVLLACDGVWDVVTSQEAITYVHQFVYNKSFNTRKSTIQSI